MPKWAQVALAVAVVAALLAMFMPHAQRGNPHARRVQCLANVSNLAVAVTMYVEDYDRPPDPRLWSDQLAEYVVNADVFRCPQVGDTRCGYALNAGASGVDRRLRFSRDAGRLVTIFESDRGWNAHGGRELLPRAPRHLGGDVYGFLDGHSDWIRRGDPDARIDWGAPAGQGAGK